MILSYFLTGISIVLSVSSASALSVDEAKWQIAGAREIASELNKTKLGMEFKSRVLKAGETNDDKLYLSDLMDKWAKNQPQKIVAAGPGLLVQLNSQKWIYIKKGPEANQVTVGKNVVTFKKGVSLRRAIKQALKTSDQAARFDRGWLSAFFVTTAEAKEITDDDRVALPVLALNSIINAFSEYDTPRDHENNVECVRKSRSVKIDIPPQTVVATGSAKTSGDLVGGDSQEKYTLEVFNEETKTKVRIETKKDVYWGDVAGMFFNSGDPVVFAQTTFNTCVDLQCSATRVATHMDLKNLGVKFPEEVEQSYFDFSKTTKGRESLEKDGVVGGYDYERTLKEHFTPILVDAQWYLKACEDQHFINIPMVKLKLPTRRSLEQRREK